VGRNIGPCLDSLGFCEERIVVDCGSEDDTVERASTHGARVEHQCLRGVRRTEELRALACDWSVGALVDADERVSPALAAEIAAAINEGNADGYETPRLSSFLGRVMRHSGWYPDYVLRLFRRGRARFSDDIVHERVVCDGMVLRLNEPLHPVDRYSSAGAEKLVASGRRVTFASGFLHGFWTFLRTYILRAGFLDGHEGLLLAIANAERTYYRYMKAWWCVETVPARAPAVAASRNDAQRAATA
jgi:glycosyltransferase involved in cell wall biosynthesis